MVTKFEFWTRWQKVISSNVKSVRYDKKLFQLEITFLSGGKYQYDNVPEVVYQDLMASDSKGSFVYWNIRDSYTYRKL